MSPILFSLLITNKDIVEKFLLPVGSDRLLFGPVLCVDDSLVGFVLVPTWKKGLASMALRKHSYKKDGNLGVVCDLYVHLMDISLSNLLFVFFFVEFIKCFDFVLRFVIKVVCPLLFSRFCDKTLEVFFVFLFSFLELVFDTFCT